MKRRVDAGGHHETASASRTTHGAARAASIVVGDEVAPGAGEAVEELVDVRRQ